MVELIALRPAMRNSFVPQFRFGPPAPFDFSIGPNSQVRRCVNDNRYDSGRTTLVRHASDYEAINLLMQSFSDTGWHEAAWLLPQLLMDGPLPSPCFANNLFLCQLLITGDPDLPPFCLPRGTSGMRPK